MDADAHAAETVRHGDRDRYLADLFAPQPARGHLFALHAFNVEVARVRDAVSEPGLGEIRLQFWRDAIHADGAGHPLGQALTKTIDRFGLPLEAFENLLEARRFDLYDDPMPSLNDLEGYAGETSSSLMQLAAIILADGNDPGTAEAAGHGGVAYALVGLLQAVPVHARRGQCYVPLDLLDAHDVNREQIFSGQSSPGLLMVLAELGAVARRHLESARHLIGAVEPILLPAFLPLALVEPQLEHMKRTGYDPFAPGTGTSQLRRQWLLWRAARRGTV